MVVSAATVVSTSVAPLASRAITVAGSKWWLPRFAVTS
jgi:hypothetical protein